MIETSAESSSYLYSKRCQIINKKKRLDDFESDRTLRNLLVSNSIVDLQRFPFPIHSDETRLKMDGSLFVTIAI